jgi:hypothetical protein
MASGAAVTDLTVALAVHVLLVQRDPNSLTEFRAHCRHHGGW